MIQIKSEAEIALMRAAGLLVGRTLERLREAVAPGVTTADLDADRGGVHPRGRRRPVVPRLPRLPGHICASVNDEIVHGIPVRGCCARATSSPWTAARSSTAGTATPRSRCRSATCPPS